MEYTELLEKQIIGRLKVDNPWWTEGSIPDYYAKMSPRLYLDIFMPLVQATGLRRALILMGPRRVGKTVMMYHAIQRLIDSGVSAQNIIYISVETPIYNKIYLEQLFILACQILGKNATQEQMYVFYDEIQYLKEWEIDLKSLVDTYRNVKFVASGSAAAELKKRSDESGAGRFTDFSLPPLTFYEYIHLKHYSNIMLPTSLEWHGIEAHIYQAIDLQLLNNVSSTKTCRDAFLRLSKQDCRINRLSRRLGSWLRRKNASLQFGNNRVVHIKWNSSNSN